MGLSSGLTGLGEALRDDTLGSPASGAEESGGGVSLSIISGRRSPEDELIGEGLRPELQKIYAVVIFSEEKDDISVLLKYSGSLMTRGRIDPPADFVQQ